MLLIIIWIGFGIGCFYNASTCKERDQIPCTGALESEYYGSIIGGVLLCAVGALHALWLCCVRARIYFTAKLLQAVSTVLGWCPGTIIISVLLSLLTVVWCTQARIFTMCTISCRPCPTTGSRALCLAP